MDRPQETSGLEILEENNKIIIVDTSKEPNRRHQPGTKLMPDCREQAAASE